MNIHGFNTDDQSRLLETTEPSNIFEIDDSASQSSLSNPPSPPVLSNEAWLHDVEMNTTQDYFSQPTRCRTDLFSNKSAMELGTQSNHISPWCRSMSFDALMGQSPRMQKFNSRKPNMRLPLFSDTETTKDVQELLAQGSTVSGQALCPGPTMTGTTLLHAPVGVAPLLTPPVDVGQFQWPSLGQSGATCYRSSASTTPANGETMASTQRASSTTTTRPTEIMLPAFVAMSGNNNHSSTWLERANRTIISNLNKNTHATQVQMIVQALPSQTKSTNTKPVFQELVERIQQQTNDVPYITITHAVSQIMSMEAVPASPPATPNVAHHSDDYFENQTIYTHAAVVPTYHNIPFAAKSTFHRPSSVIAAPSSIDISILERYIPPTSVEEVQDFFSISRKSYLVDRMTELSACNGTLLLIYPTQKGGSTFAKQYIGPIIDPFLRGFVLLNDMTSNAASALGAMASVGDMADFDSLRVCLHDLCKTLTQRAPNRGIRSVYSVLHAEATEVTIDRTTWLEWYLEQEHGRLRQNLVDYQKAGGRMPQRGFQATPGSLAREVVDGIRDSEETAGGVGIEVGVFVIRRSLM